MFSLVHAQLQFPGDSHPSKLFPSRAAPKACPEAAGGTEGEAMWGAAAALVAAAAGEALGNEGTSCVREVCSASSCMLPRDYNTV